ncbi:30S ribosomal protein S12-like protein [Leptotrombidium deliense]|uniref:Small ribosomal subunit protein uS12m n=1 Tax=Leptotrombidium deliense TaxID=299467 RepID=A0A443SII5_9ACAR|nr:30S ribosomal protein S12-like protein [Leptotrombidium deliense]
MTKCFDNKNTWPVLATERTNFNNQLAFNSTILRNYCYQVMTPTSYDYQRFLTLKNIHERGPVKPRKRVHPLDSRPKMKGVVIRTLVKKPKKPNSANRKCVLVRLSNGKEAVCFIPGVGHNLQEHSVVMVRNHRTKDVPGLKLRVIRGECDCAPIVRKPNP